jgi:hypothetical protein
MVRHRLMVHRTIDALHRRVFSSHDSPCRSPLDGPHDLFHEGPTDDSTLLSCARGLHRRQPARMQRFEEWTPVELCGAANAPTGELLAHLVSTELIPPLAENDRLAMVTALDRDYDRERGRGARSAGSPVRRRAPGCRSLSEREHCRMDARRTRCDPRSLP